MVVVVVVLVLVLVVGVVCGGQEPRQLSDLPPPSPCVPGLCPFLPLHRDVPFC